MSAEGRRSSLNGRCRATLVSVGEAFGSDELASFDALFQRLVDEDHVLPGPGVSGGVFEAIVLHDPFLDGWTSRSLGIAKTRDGFNDHFGEGWMGLGSRLGLGNLLGRLRSG